MEFHSFEFVDYYFSPKRNRYEMQNRRAKKVAAYARNTGPISIHRSKSFLHKFIANKMPVL